MNFSASIFIKYQFVCLKIHKAKNIFIFLNFYSHIKCNIKIGPDKPKIRRFPRKSGIPALNRFVTATKINLCNYFVKFVCLHPIKVGFPAIRIQCSISSLCDVISHIPLSEIMNLDFRNYASAHWREM